MTMGSIKKVFFLVCVFYEMKIYSVMMEIGDKIRLNPEHFEQNENYFIE